MITIIQKPLFRKTYKKLHIAEKKVVDVAIKTIAKNPELGELKKGDLAGLSVYKFKMNNQQKLLAYTYHKTQIVLIGLGTHENFYRNLKKSL